MRILIATDFSPASDEALRQGFARARAVGGQVVVCHVVPEISQLQGLFPQQYAVDLARHMDQQPKALSAIREQASRVLHDSSVEPDMCIDEGAPYAAILTQAEKWGAQMIFVGSGTRSGLERLVLGSVAARVVRYAQCPVVVTRPGKSGLVLVATDLSDPSMPALEAGAEEARWRNARLVVLHVGEVANATVASAFMGAVPVVLPEDLLLVRRNAAHELIRTALDRFAIQADVEVIDGDPATEILNYAESLPAELLVVGTRGRTGLTRVLLGSVAERLVRDAPCSVLAVRLHVS